MLSLSVVTLNGSISNWLFHCTQIEKLFIHGLCFEKSVDFEDLRKVRNTRGFWEIPTPITQPGDLAGKHVVNLLSWPYYNFLVDPINPFHPIACHEDKNLQ